MNAQEQAMQQEHSKFSRLTHALVAGSLVVAGAFASLGNASQGEAHSQANPVVATEVANMNQEGSPVLSEIRFEKCDPNEPTVIKGEVLSTSLLSNPKLIVNGTEATLEEGVPSDTELDFAWDYEGTATSLDFQLSSSDLQFDFYDNYPVPENCIAEDATTTTSSTTSTTVRPTTTSSTTSTTVRPTTTSSTTSTTVRPTTTSSTTSTTGMVPPPSGEAAPLEPVTTQNFDGSLSTGNGEVLNTQVASPAQPVMGRPTFTG